MALLITNPIYANPLYVSILRYEKRSGTLNEVGQDPDTGEKIVTGIIKTYCIGVSLLAYTDASKEKKVHIENVTGASLEHTIVDFPRDELDDYAGSEMEFVYNKLKEMLTEFGEIADA